MHFVADLRTHRRHSGFLPRGADSTLFFFTFDCEDGSRDTHIFFLRVLDFSSAAFCGGHLNRSRFLRSISAEGRGEQYTKKLGSEQHSLLHKESRGWRRIAGKTGGIHQLGKDGSGSFSMSKKISTIVFLHDQPDLVHFSLLALVKPQWPHNSPGPSNRVPRAESDTVRCWSSLVSRRC